MGQKLGELRASFALGQAHVVDTQKITLVNSFASPSVVVMDFSNFNCFQTCLNSR